MALAKCVAVLSILITSVSLVETQIATLPIRIVGGKHRYEGKIEVLHNGKWGEVCDHKWNLAGARVACRMLGYPDAERFTFGSIFWFMNQIHGTGQRTPGLSRLLSKARSGQPVTMVIIGGSNSVGEGLEHTEQTFYNQFADWWNQEIYNNTGANLTVHSASLGAAGSDFFLNCLQNFLPKQQPDIVLVEQAVNNYGTEYGKTAEPIELLTRRLLTMTSRPFVMYINLLNPRLQNDTISNKKCDNAQDIGLDELSKHYEIPSINLRDIVCPLTKFGKREFNASKLDMFAKDGGHSGIKAHTTVASKIIQYFRNKWTDFLSLKSQHKTGKLGKSEKLIKPVFSNPLIEDNQLNDARCWSHLTSNWRVPLSQTLDARVIESRGFTYRSPFETRAEFIAMPGQLRNDSAGGWYAKQGSVRLEIQFHFFPPHTLLTVYNSTKRATSVLRSVAVLLKFRPFLPLSIKMQLNGKKTSCIEMTVKSSNSFTTYIRALPIANDVPPGYYSLTIEGTVEWLGVLGVALGNNHQYWHKSYKPFNGTLNLCRHFC